MKAEKKGKYKKGCSPSLVSVQPPDVKAKPKRSEDTQRELGDVAGTVTIAKDLGVH